MMGIAQAPPLRKMDAHVSSAFQVWFYQHGCSSRGHDTDTRCQYNRAVNMTRIKQHMYNGFSEILVCGLINIAICCVRCGLGDIPGATQPLEELLGNGASQRMFRKFIESSYATLDPERQKLLSSQLPLPSHS